MAQGTLAAITLTATDPDGEPLTYELSSGPSNGTLVPDPALPDVLYTPAAGFSGTDRFQFTASDGQCQAQPATVWIWVAAVYEPARLPTLSPCQCDGALQVHFRVTTSSPRGAEDVDLSSLKLLNACDASTVPGDISSGLSPDGAHVSGSQITMTFDDQCAVNQSILRCFGWARCGGEQGSVDVRVEGAFTDGLPFMTAPAPTPVVNP